MRFEPKSEEQLAVEELCPIGPQLFTVLESSEGTSKSGKAQIKLKLNVHGADGFDYHIYDYISPEYLAHKFRHFWVSVNRLADYERGDIEAEASALKGLQGWADIVHQKATSAYPAKAAVRDYVTGNSPKAGQARIMEAVREAVKEAPGKPVVEDDVPF